MFLQYCVVWLVIVVALWVAACIVGAKPAGKTVFDMRKRLEVVEKLLPDVSDSTEHFEQLDRMCGTPKIAHRKDIKGLARVERWIVQTLCNGITRAALHKIPLVRAVQDDYTNGLCGLIENIEKTNKLDGSCTEYISAALYDHACAWSTHEIAQPEWCKLISGEHVQSCVESVVKRSYTSVH